MSFPSLLPTDVCCGGVSRVFLAFVLFLSGQTLDFMGWGPEAVAESRQVGRHCHAAFLTPNILRLPRSRLHGRHRFSSPRLPFPFLPLLHVAMHARMSFVNVDG